MLTIEEFVRYVAPSIGSTTRPVPRRCPGWPADVFAIAAALLEKSGAYAVLGTRLWPGTEPLLTARRGLSPDLVELTKRAGSLDEHHFRLEEIAMEWRSLCDDAIQRGSRRYTVPEAAQLLWRDIYRSSGARISEIADNHVLCCALFNLIAICDEVFAGVGVLLMEGSKNIHFWIRAEQYLGGANRFETYGATLCDQIDPSRLRVLPKCCTPKSGLSLRSLTHHLSFCPPIDLNVRWFSMGVDPEVMEPSFCNLLLLPWPFEIAPGHFQPFDCGTDRTPRSGASQAWTPDEIGWFTYQPGDGRLGSIVSEVEGLVDRAIQQVGEIHVVVLPELALTLHQYEQLRDVLTRRGIALIAGVGDSSSAETGGSSNSHSVGHSHPWPRNFVATAFPDPVDREGMINEYFQNKHHRWKLDAGQIIRYGLSSQLDPEQDWWEAMHVHPRGLNFLRIREWMTACVLVCEDLARIDPVGRFVRSVAPDLVIALLMDGPQLQKRWPAYHATVLTDDPGSAVLTLTSLGMSKLSRDDSRIGDPPSRTIAMWRDVKSGIREITLPADAHAAVLTIARRYEPEFTADGRLHQPRFVLEESDGQTASEYWVEVGLPSFGGICFV